MIALTRGLVALSLLTFTSTIVSSESTPSMSPEWMSVLNNSCPHGAFGRPRGGLVHNAAKRLTHSISALREQISVREIDTKCTVLSAQELSVLNGIICRTRRSAVSSIQATTALLTHLCLKRLQEIERNFEVEISQLVNSDRECVEWRESELFQNIIGLIEIER